MKFNDRNISIHPSTVLGENVQIGDNTTIYANVVIGDDSIIANDCVIGEPLSEYYFRSDYIQPTTLIGKNCLIRSHSVIYASAVIGDFFSCGHRITVRENSLFGEHCRVGTLSDIQGDCTFGDYVWLHSNVHIGKLSEIQSFVFIYPYVVLTNDLIPPSNSLKGATIHQFSQIGTGSVILPGIQVHEHALIGAHSSVTKDVGAFSCVVGNPARHVKDVREIRTQDGSSAYPWPLRFERGMPWEGIGFKNWQEQNSNL